MARPVSAVKIPGNTQTKTLTKKTWFFILTKKKKREKELLWKKKNSIQYKIRNLGHDFWLL